jgi:spermidine/putrescine transport system permease protein
MNDSNRPPTAAWILLLPLLAWLAAFVVAPLVILILYSFCQRDELGQVVWQFTLENYTRSLDPLYLHILWRSLWYAALTTVLCAGIGYPVGYAIGRAPERWRNRLLMAVMVPFWTSFLIRTYAWMAILKENGLLNGLLQALHLVPAIIPRPLDILYTPTAVAIGLLYTYLPFMILPIYASAEKLDRSLLEASADLGATPWRTFVRVIAPLTMPGVAAGAVLVFVPAIGMFAITDLMGGGRVPLVGNVIQQQFTGQGRDAPFGSALAVVLLAMFAVSSLAILWRRGEPRSPQFRGMTPH